MRQTTERFFNWMNTPGQDVLKTAIMGIFLLGSIVAVGFTGA